MWLLVVPLILLVAAVVGVLSLLGAVFGIVGAAWPWLLIGLGVWLFWCQDGRHRRHARRDWRRGGPAPVSSASATARTSPRRPSPSEPVPIRPQAKRELPMELQVKVEHIRRKVDVLLAHADRFPPFSQDLYLVRQTASDYLPRTVEAFLHLPPDAVDRPLTIDGKTPRQELAAQLDLLDTKLDEIARSLQSQDVQKLLANRQFLEQRFGTREAATGEAAGA